MIGHWFRKREVSGAPFHMPPFNGMCICVWKARWVFPLVLAAKLEDGRLGSWGRFGTSDSSASRQVFSGVLVGLLLGFPVN